MISSSFEKKLVLQLKVKSKKGKISLREKLATASKMSGGRATSPRLELRLNLSPPRADVRYHLQTKDSPKSSSSSPSSCESSCVSSSSTGLEENHNSSSSNKSGVNIGCSGDYPRPPVVTSMVVVGCPRCLMYVMLSEVDPKCPRCKSSVLLDFVGEDNPSTRKN